MVALRKNGAKLAYPLCDQTVTVYHFDGIEVRRTIHYRAFLDFRKVENVNKTGSRDASSFLLVIPGLDSSIAVGDKVMRGLGPEVEGASGWRDLIPAKVPGLAVVAYVDPKFSGGKQTHVEVGG